MEKEDWQRIFDHLPRNPWYQHYLRSREKWDEVEYLQKQILELKKLINETDQRSSSDSKSSEL